MATIQDNLKDLILSPRESLDVELKSWLDPSTPDGIAKIARGCIALRNNNGGYFLIGFTDAGTPDASVPQDVRRSFHPDVVQAIAAKYASQPFEVRVEFVERDGVEYPVLYVPNGVETPVAAKADLAGTDGKFLIRTDAVYVRSLRSNNTVSTTSARWQDWPRLVKICFDNREADIGAFIRRHLSSHQFEQVGRLLAGQVPEPAPTERAREYLTFGHRRFAAECARRKIEIPQIGTREASIAISGPIPTYTASAEFLNRLEAAKPRHSGWTPWIDSRNAHNENDRPYVFDGGWEALLIHMGGAMWGAHLDFWRTEPNGLFYQSSGIEDDLPHPRVQKPAPGTTLDFLLQLSRVTEIISVGLSFARSMNCEEQGTSLAFAFRWTRLNGRRLASWADPTRSLFSRGASHQDEITTSTIVPLEVAQSALTAHVEEAVNPLFELFHGTHLDSAVVDGIVRDTLDRHF